MGHHRGPKTITQDLVGSINPSIRSISGGRGPCNSDSNGPDTDPSGRILEDF